MQSQYRLLDGLRFSAAMASTYYILHSERNYFGRQFDKYHIHRNDIDSCRRHRINYRLDTCTVNVIKKMKILNFLRNEQINDGRYSLCQNGRHIFDNQLVPFAAYHIQCRSIPLTFFGQSGGLHSHRDSIGNCKIAHNMASIMTK